MLPNVSLGRPDDGFDTPRLDEIDFEVDNAWLTGSDTRTRDCEHAGAGRCERQGHRAPDTA